MTARADYHRRRADYHRSLWIGSAGPQRSSLKFRRKSLQGIIKLTIRSHTHDKQHSSVPGDATLAIHVATNNILRNLIDYIIYARRETYEDEDKLKKLNIYLI